MMPYPIAMIPYTNMAPYRALGPPSGCRFVSCVPRESVRLLAKGEVLAAAAPVGGLPELERVVEPVGRFGIGAGEKSQSVLFFSDRPLAGFCDPAAVCLTDESASSVRLLYLLMGYWQGFNRLPCLTDDIKKANGELVIGDRALRTMRKWQEQSLVSRPPEHGFGYVADLATEWYAAHGLPFVFARWVIRRDAPSDFKRLFNDWLVEFGGREEEMVDLAAPEAAESLGVPIEYILDYFRVIRRRLGDDDLAGQELFLEELNRHVRDPLFPRCPD